VGVRSPAVDLYPLLARGPSFAEDGEALLLQAAGDGVLYLSPTRDGFGDLHRSVPLVRARLAEAAAVREPGGFVTLADHSGRTVLQASRPVRGQPWVVAQQVDAGQALALADERRGFLLLALGLLLVAMLALAVSAWRHGSSVRAQQQAAAFRAQAEELARQTELLNAISANTDALTVLADRAGRVRFANRAAAELASVPVGALTGQPLGAVLPAGLAAELAALGAAATAAGVPQRQVVALADGAATAAGRRFQASAIPVALLGTERDLVLHVLQDVTELEATRRRHDDLLRDLVAALVRAVERHDPFAAEHAGRVAEVADALARELGLADVERESLELAATLANVGKVTLPAALLAKTGPLDEAERAELRSHVQRSLDLLQGLPFEGPVLELIAQKQEHVDGSGYPRGLSGDALSLPGRILAVANAFVALASARAYRDGVPLREAAAALLADADTRYDRGVVAALLHVVENRRDWSAWETSRRR
jgi:HD-GYP domain-containing protein (c-di-GMP phosphodiesterase class II)